MKVLNIEELKKTDGSSYWEVTIPKKDGTASKSPLVEWTKPTYNIGDELPFEIELIKPDKARWYYKRKDTPAQVIKGETRQQKSFTASPEKIESIEYQNCRNLAVQLYCHTTDAGVELDNEYLGRCFRAVEALNAENYLVKEAKKMGAVEK